MGPPGLPQCGRPPVVVMGEYKYKRPTYGVQQRCGRPIRYVIRERASLTERERRHCGYVLRFTCCCPPSLRSQG